MLLTVTLIRPAPGPRSRGDANVRNPPMGDLQSVRLRPVAWRHPFEQRPEAEATRDRGGRATGNRGTGRRGSEFENKSATGDRWTAICTTPNWTTTRLPTPRR